MLCGLFLQSKCIIICQFFNVNWRGEKKSFVIAKATKALKVKGTTNSLFGLWKHPNIGENIQQ